MNELPYITPEGFVDDPFVYVFDGSGLTAGADALNLSQPITQRDDFLLRRIVGVTGLTETGWRWRRASGADSMSNFLRPTTNYTVAPESLFPIGSVIRFDLQTVLLANIPCGEREHDILAPARIGFQGVRRRRALGSFAVGHYESTYPYYEIPWSYTFTLTVDWFHYVVAPNVQSSRKRVVPIIDYDFELQSIKVARDDGSIPTTEEFSIILYDASGYNQLSSGMLPLSWWNRRRAALFNSVYPVPSMVYPVKTQIAFDVQSNICNEDEDFPKTYQMEFQGIARKPK